MYKKFLDETLRRCDRKFDEFSEEKFNLDYNGEIITKSKVRYMLLQDAFVNCIKILSVCDREESLRFVDGIINKYDNPFVIASLLNHIKTIQNSFSDIPNFINLFICFSRRLMNYYNNDYFCGDSYTSEGVELLKMATLSLIVDDKRMNACMKLLSFTFLFDRLKQSLESKGHRISWGYWDFKCPYYYDVLNKYKERYPNSPIPFNDNYEWDFDTSIQRIREIYDSGEYMNAQYEPRLDFYWD